MNWILLFILYLNYEICSNSEDGNEPESFEEPTESDFEKELEEDKRFIEEMDLLLEKYDEISREEEKELSQTFKELDDMFEEIKNRQTSSIKNGLF